MGMSLFVDEFAEKSVKKYISEGLWLLTSLSDYYMYLEYYDEGGYGSIHKVMDRFSGEYLILKRSSKKDFVGGTINDSYFHLNPNHKIDENNLFTSKLQASKEAEYMVKVYHKLGGIKLCDYYDDDDHYIIVMEDGGRSLEDIVSSHRKKITDLLRYEAYQTNFFYHNYLTQVKQYMIKIYHKIKDIHDLGIHHNDLKPENILICEKELTIIDFGVAKSIDSEVFQSFKGTLEYIPYEYVSSGSYKPWDHTLWCFGVILHFLTLMKYPFLREEDILEYNLNEKKINKLPPTFSELIYDCLQKDPSQRPQDLLNRLQNLQTY